jgi:transketolase
MTAGTNVDGLEAIAHSVRRTVIRMCMGRGQGYAGQGLALADVMAHLFFRAMRSDGIGGFLDRFVLSTGHSAIALYAVLGELGYYEQEELATYGMPGSRIEESPLEGAPGFEITGGALGQGLSQAVGMALGERLRGSDATVYCLLSDGELQEGQTWEAMMAAAHYKLGNLVVLIDNNRIQADGWTADVMNVEPVTDKLAAFGLDPIRIDPHDHEVLAARLPAGGRIGTRPLAIVCQTVPGKGVPSIEAYRKVHYIRAAPHVWQTALAELA